MTIKDLYEFAKENKFEDYEIEIQYRDGGGSYYGTDTLQLEDIEVQDFAKTVVL